MLQNNTRGEELMKVFETIVHGNEQDLMQENANVDGRSPMGVMGTFASESAKYYAVENLLSDQVKKAINENILYPHDLDFYATGTTTCSQIPLAQMLANGFHTGHGHMRQPQDIKSALALSSIIFQANQNMQHGGQSFALFDIDLAPYVRKTIERHKKRLQSYPLTKEQIEEFAWKETENDTYQACEAFVHNSNSMHSRGGGQVPFISINYGTDTSKEGRMLIKQLLKATQAGLGKGETPIFPIQIFKMKKGVNFEESDPNYDLFELALETTAERLFPNFSFLDAPFNAVHYDGRRESEVCYMGCRTRVMSNIHGEETAIGRGNLSFTSINLVKLALISGSKEAFFEALNYYLDLGIKQLLERFAYQCTKRARDFQFLYSQGVWRGGEALQPEDSVASILKQGTLSVGFIGLAECLVALTGKHHGEDEESWKLGYEIISFMRDRMDKATEEHQLNFSIIATPAEGLSGKFVKKDREEFGEISGITNHNYYTNSFHIPVYYNIQAINKIRLEGPFHALCNGGHITYIELDGAAMHNKKALKQIVQAMAEHGVGYGSINHPVDRCKCCSYHGVIGNECPSCGNEDEANIERIRRITGYLVGDMSKWNSAKRSEEIDRVKHK
ncbi:MULTISPECIES: anaerobic ribonucleoside triphosphate reductase [Bacillus cereus group]|uniref:Anaerobic ribonucleoside-triphosphate reductase n=2 Tax=Bacillus cereus group TaxID=86661 RepID=A0A9X7AW95_BACTU|nr:MULTISPECIES: anaerobic ribonucleoside triphosphate reductase [Bacillus cereus group]MCQ6287772.1 anaerobic ribonucleoside triphosphate reductase [Bacillus cereus]MCQ6305858.1 anaerobic ribonucleoside triphosphate reductase [Bacillus cereus]MCQ6316745.1 anaerobic ribonucleoside triphosphate reductase [Bacillus cereus]MCQ6328998.1 anaerobic ribonucleoside triphosphate reductase [Bacillus cereus]MCQ6340977.1 anaerobic ribonucleoside triphosphate reductase [Bacillus cereus]